MKRNNWGLEKLQSTRWWEFLKRICPRSPCGFWITPLCLALPWAKKSCASSCVCMCFYDGLKRKEDFSLARAMKRQGGGRATDVERGDKRDGIGKSGHYRPPPLIKTRIFCSCVHAQCKCVCVRKVEGVWTSLGVHGWWKIPNHRVALPRAIYLWVTLGPFQWARSQHDTLNHRLEDEGAAIFYPPPFR